MNLHEPFLKENISPAELARLRKRSQTNSTRDQRKLIETIKEIESLLKSLNYKIILISKSSDDAEF